MTSKGIKTIEFTLPIYGGKIIVMLFDKWDEVVKAVKNKGFIVEDIDNMKNIDGLAISGLAKDRHSHLIIIKRNSNSRETLVHELFHMTQDILEYRGVDFIKGDSNEAYAYLIGYLYSVIEKILE